MHQVDVNAEASNVEHRVMIILLTEGKKAFLQLHTFTRHTLMLQVKLSCVGKHESALTC